MQLTRLDRWLRERYVYETHIYTLRMPDHIPVGTIAEELPEAPGRRFRHRFILRSESAVNELVAHLRDANQMFTTRVVDREEWYVPFIAPQGKSVTWWFVWFAISLVGAYGLLQLARMAWANPNLQKNLGEALEILKG